MAIAGGGLSIIQKLYSELDDDFKSVLENDLHAQSMYELLKLPNAHVISPFILAVLHHYDEDEQCFRFGEKILTITLEDVLYITGLPIFGKPVICDGSYKKDIFLHIFPSITSSYLKRQNRISMDELRGIAKNTNIDEVQRKRAVLLTLAYNIITPSSDGHGVPPNLAPYFDDVEDVDNYAWGASLLSVLYSSLKKYKEKGVKKLDGNLWVVLDQAACTKTGINTFENPKKPLFLKELKKTWNSEFHMPLLEKGKYDESNTILLDDSPCKALLNPPYTAVFPPSYKFHNASTDKSLGPEGDLYIYLGKLAEAENVPKYVENNMFGNMAITEKHEHWSHYIDINEKVHSLRATARERRRRFDWSQN